MHPSRQQEVIAKIHAQTGRLYCCRCRIHGEKDQPSSLFKYGAFFCSDECAELAREGYVPKGFTPTNLKDEPRAI